MLFEIMVHIKNFFPTELSEETEYKIEGGVISLPFVSDGQYIRIEGSTLNDGVYQYPVADLTDEEFKGTITVLAPPKSFLELVKEIETFQKKYEATPFASESFGGYSYTKSDNGSSWASVFKSRLNTWRKL